jgi:TolB protein
MAGAGTCVGCHVLSRDGTRISLGLDIPAPSPYKVFDVATRAMIYAQGTPFGGGSNFFSFSPDTTQIMTSNGASIVLRDAKDGTAITDPLVSVGAMPDWSPLGVSMVFAKPSTPPPCIGGFCGAPGVDAASIEVLKKTAGVWDASSSTLVPFGGQNNYYPTYSPDGAFVLFNRSPSNQNSFDAKDALVWVVDGGGGTPVQLATASTGGDSWPKWAPQVQSYKSGQLMWLTFSSRRAYGLRLADGSTAQIWMVGFDPAKAKAGLDPTGPAFWLPFQDLGSGNHIAQWVTKVERKPCGADTECASGEICRAGKCYPVIK